MKNSFIILVLLFMSTMSLAQDEVNSNVDRKAFIFEIQSGTGLSWISGFKDATEIDGTVDLSIKLGLGLTYAFNGRFGIETGAYWSDLGNNYKSDNDGTTIDGNFSFSYLQIPVIAKFDFANSLDLLKSTSYGIKAGGQLGFNIMANDFGEVTYDGETNSYANELDVNNNIDFLIGLYSYTQNWGYGIDYAMGLNTIFKEGETDMKNRSIRMVISYRF